MEVDHREPYPGDNGILFELKDDSPRALERLAKVKLRAGKKLTGAEDRVEKKEASS